MLPFLNSTYFHDLVESFTNGVVIVNTAGEVYVANQAAAQVLGRPLSGPQGTWREFFQSMEHPEAFEAFMQEAMEPDRCLVPHQMRCTRPDGQLTYLSITSSPLVEFNKVFGVMLLLTDITQIFLMHERERNMLQEKTILQKERIDSLNFLSQAVAHQIRNPMTTIGGMANLMRRKLRDSDCNVDKYLEGVLDASRRLETIVSAVSEYTSLTPRALGEVELHGVLETARDMLQHKIGNATRRLTWTMDVEAVTVRADLELLARAVFELLDNSWEAFVQGTGSISLRGWSNSRRYHLVVTDTGDGIQRELLPYVLDPFFTTKPMSVGMGLSRANRIIKEHQGRLYVSSQPGHGTEVAVDLPLPMPGDE